MCKTYPHYYHWYSYIEYKMENQGAWSNIFVVHEILSRKMAKTSEWKSHNDNEASNVFGLCINIYMLCQRTDWNGIHVARVNIKRVTYYLLQNTYLSIYLADKH